MRVLPTDGDTDLGRGRGGGGGGGSGSGLADWASTVTAGPLLGP